MKPKKVARIKAKIQHLKKKLKKRRNVIEGFAKPCRK